MPRAAIWELRRHFLKSPLSGEQTKVSYEATVDRCDRAVDRMLALPNE